MCGRFTNTLSWKQIVQLYRITEPGPDAAPNLQPRYNIAPTQYAPVVRAIPGGRQLEMLRWGLAWKGGLTQRDQQIDLQSS